MKTGMFMAAALILAGCAATPVKPELGSYVGQNVSTLSSRLGPAGNQSSNGSDTVYTWTKIETVDRIVNSDEFQSTQSAEGSSRFNSNQCKVMATADGAGVVKSIRTNGTCTHTIELLLR